MQVLSGLKRVCKMVLESRSKRLFGWFLRATLGLFTICLGAVTLVTLAAHIANPNPACLTIVTDHIDVLDPQTGDIFSFGPPQDVASLVQSPTSEQPMPLAYSSNRKRLAYLIDYSSTGLHTAQFVTPHTSLFEQLSYYYDSSTSEIQWSPDNQWIAYHWQGNDDQQYLAIADANGHQRSITRIESTVADQIHFADWSADSKYLAVVAQGPLGRADQISFFSAPDLQIVATDTLGASLSGGCSSVEILDSYQNCNPWSLRGHTAAYVSDKDANTSILVMINMSGSNRQTFPLPAAGIRTVRISPNGQSVAVGSLVLGEIVNSTSDGDLDIYNVDGSISRKIGKVNFANIGETAAPPYAQMAWSPDGRFIVYLRRNPDSPAQMQMIAYYLDTRENRILDANLPQDTYGLSIAGDGRYVAVYTPYRGQINELQLVRIDGKATTLLSSSLPIPVQVKWSASGETLAYIVYKQNGVDMAVEVTTDGGATISKIDESSTVYQIQWTDCN